MFIHYRIWNVCQAIIMEDSAAPRALLASRHIIRSLYKVVYSRGKLTIAPCNYHPVKLWPLNPERNILNCDSVVILLDHAYIPVNELE